MLKSRISTLVDLIPRESKIYTPAEQRVEEKKSSDLVVHRLAHAYVDPAFQWNFAQAFVELNLPLPEVVKEPYIKLAHAHGMKQSYSEDIADGLVLQHPSWKIKRGFLRALLLLKELNLNNTAQMTGIPILTLLAYEQLFWNVRDRLDDPLYMQTLCYPLTPQIEYQADHWKNADPCDLMLRAAFRHDCEGVLEIFGIRLPRREMSPEVYMEKIVPRFLAHWEHIVRCGGSSSEIPAMKEMAKMVVKVVVTASKNNGPKQLEFDDTEMGLGAIARMDHGQSILATLKQLEDNTKYDEMLALQRSLQPELFKDDPKKDPDNSKN
jgi:hypothetical protein